MDARGRWKALQGHLSQARAFARAGDRARALEEVERALAVDPDYLAAHSLREQLKPDLPPASRRSDGFSVTPADGDEACAAALEVRARGRRAERRLMAACDELARGNCKGAGIALDEARELGADPGDVLRVEQALATRRRRRSSSWRAPRRVGPWMAAAATAAAGVLGATYIGERNAIPAQGILTVEPTPSAGQPVGTTGEARAAAPGGATSESVGVRQDITRASVIVTPVVPGEREAPPAPRPDLGEPRPAPLEPVAPPFVPPFPPPAAAAAVLASALPSAPVDPVMLPSAQPVALPRQDDSGVRDVLQRYRAAYEQLNARSARAVWPAVDERALARAFDGLESQRLDFENCDVSLHGDAATATCRGTTRFVTKVGSREPTVEPRTWQFTLRKGDAGWAIETARAER